MMMVPAYVSCSESSGFVTSLYALTQFNTNELTLRYVFMEILPPNPNPNPKGRLHCMSVTPNGERLISVPPTITATATATNQPEHAR